MLVISQRVSLGFLYTTSKTHLLFAFVIFIRYLVRRAFQTAFHAHCLFSLHHSLVTLRTLILEQFSTKECKPSNSTLHAHSHQVFFLPSLSVYLLPQVTKRVRRLSTRQCTHVNTYYTEMRSWCAQAQLVCNNQTCFSECRLRQRAPLPAPLRTPSYCVSEKVVLSVFPTAGSRRLGYEA